MHHVVAPHGLAQFRFLYAKVVLIRISFIEEALKSQRFFLQQLLEFIGMLYEEELENIVPVIGLVLVIIDQPHSAIHSVTYSMGLRWLLGQSTEG